MKTITLDDITKEKFDEQADLMIDMIRSKYPRLDLRRGTVLRDLLVNPDASVASVFSEQAAEQRNSASLLRLLEREEAGETVDADDVNAILSNFDMESLSGTKATGIVRVVVSSENNYTLLEGFEFRSDINGVSFTVDKDTTASVDPSSDQTKLYTGASNWFLVNVTCSTVGANGNIGQGEALTPQSPIYGFLSATAYKTFSGGSDVEALAKTVDRIKPSLSVRSLTSRTAVESILRDKFDDTDHPIVAVSVCGYGNEAQRRDKHNAFGVAVGGRSDVYVRNFTNLPTKAVTLSGSYENGVYTLDVPASEVPGMCSVYRVSDPTSDALASYQHSEEWYADGVSGTWHDIDVSKDPHEAFNTEFRGVRITVSGVQGDDPGKEFRVEFVYAPNIVRMQEYVDDDAVRNTGSDFLVRGPVVINVSVSAVVRYEYSTPFDVSAAIDKICEYVNTSGFVGRLTRSEVAAILKNMGAKSVDLYNEDEMLHGYGYDAYGRMFELHGDALDVENARTADGMVTRDTCVFVVEPGNVQIRTIPVR